MNDDQPRDPLGQWKHKPGVNQTSAVSLENTDLDTDDVWFPIPRPPESAPNASFFGNLDAGGFDYGPVCEAVHQAWVEEESGDFSFEANSFDRNVAIIYHNDAFIVGDDKDDDGNECGYSYTTDGNPDSEKVVKDLSDWMKRVRS